MNQRIYDFKRQPEVNKYHISFLRETNCGIFAFDSTTDFETIKYFISKIFHSRSEGYNESRTNAFFVCDSAKYHKSIIIKSFVEAYGVKLLTITPY